MTWKKLDSARKYRTLNSGLTLIVPTKNDEAIPISCPVCNVFFSSNLDMRSYQNSECCCYCETKYAYEDRDGWLSGTRPARQDVTKDLKERKLLKVEIIF
jgi:hydrogenase maturation factor HypF (carbamoyltransferase family)